MKPIHSILTIYILFLFFSACATTRDKQEPQEAPISQSEQLSAQKKITAPTEKTYKRKIAIIRFSNETNYGRSLLLDEDLDKIGKQASDMLASRLIQSGRFLVFERTDLNKLLKEKNISSNTDKLIGVDTVITGSVTEFGRAIEGESGFLSSTKIQVAKAKVDIRLVDVSTGHAFYSAIGAGTASTESGQVFGFGSKAEYDATLNDRVIASAISDVIDKLVSTLEKRPWRTDILGIEGKQIYISGGKRQGLNIGDQLSIMKAGKKVKSQQSGFDISLPPKEVAKVKIVSFFGENETNEGSVCSLVDGNLDKSMINQLYVTGGNHD